MDYETDILIIGGGLNGMTLAIALAQVGQKVVLADSLSPDAQKDRDFDGRAYALALSSKRMFHAMGIWDNVSDHSQPILDIMVSDGRAGEGASPYAIHFDHNEIEEGPMGHMLEDRYLRRALLAKIENDEKITYLAPAKVLDHRVNSGFASADLDDESKVNARLIIGSDGRFSQTAGRAGIRRDSTDYQQSSLVCALAHEHPHNGVAHQFFMPAGPLAILPLPGDFSSIVWTEGRDRAEEINSMSEHDYLACLRPCFGEFLGKISLVGARFKYPLGLSLAQSLIAPRLALVGDAAHGIHPLAGQGLNLGLRDVAALAEVIATAARRGEDIGATDVLQRYQQWRRFDIAALAAVTDGVNRVFSNDNSLLRYGRDLGLAAVNALPPLRRGLIRQAAGLSGDLPKLMQGRMI